MEKKVETTIMENQMEKNMENEMETREYIGLSETIRALRRYFSAISRYILRTTPLFRAAIGGMCAKGHVDWGQCVQVCLVWSKAQVMHSHFHPQVGCRLVHGPALACAMARQKPLTQHPSNAVDLRRQP